MLPIIADIDEELKNNLLHQIDDIIRNHQDIEQALNLIDQKLLIEILGIDKDICESCRNIWKKMQKPLLINAPLLN